MLAFTGDSRWRKAFADSRPQATEASGHDGPVQPHESPRVMTIPLIVLAALSLLGGLLDLPWWHSGISAPLSWLEPVLGLHQHVPSGSVPTRFVLSIVDGSHRNNRRGCRLATLEGERGAAETRTHVPPAGVVHRLRVRPAHRPAERRRGQGGG